MLVIHSSPALVLLAVMAAAVHAAPVYRPIRSAMHGESECLEFTEPVKGLCARPAESIVMPSAKPEFLPASRPVVVPAAAPIVVEADRPEIFRQPKAEVYAQSPPKVFEQAAPEVLVVPARGVECAEVQTPLTPQSLPACSTESFEAFRPILRFDIQPAEC